MWPLQPDMIIFSMVLLPSFLFLLKKKKKQKENFTVLRGVWVGDAM